MWTIFKVFTEFVTILLPFLFLFFLASRHVASYFPHQGENLHALHLKVKSQQRDHQGNLYVTL